MTEKQEKKVAVHNEPTAIAAASIPILIRIGFNFSRPASEQADLVQVAMSRAMELTEAAAHWKPPEK